MKRQRKAGIFTGINQLRYMTQSHFQRSAVQDLFDLQIDIIKGMNFLQNSVISSSPFFVELYQMY